VTGDPSVMVPPPALAGWAPRTSHTSHLHHAMVTSPASSPNAGFPVLLNSVESRKHPSLVVCLRKVETCHGPCLVTFFPKNNQRTAPMEFPMMAASPLFSATIITSHPRRTYIGAPSEYFLHSATTNKTCIPIIVITNQHHVLCYLPQHNQSPTMLC